MPKGQSATRMHEQVVNVIMQLDSERIFFFFFFNVIPFYFGDVTQFAHEIVIISET